MPETLLPRAWGWAWGCRGGPPFSVSKVQLVLRGEKGERPSVSEGDGGVREASVLCFSVNKLI